MASLNGAIGGLVSITAAPDIAEHYWAVVIGGVGGAIVVVGLKLLERLKIDDGVGAVPAHLFAGIWGTLAVSIAGAAISCTTHWRCGHRRLSFLAPHGLYGRCSS